MIDEPDGTQQKQVIISSHGYVETYGDFVSTSMLGFDDSGKETEPYEAARLADFDLTWPGWPDDPRLLAAITKWLFP